MKTINKSKFIHRRYAYNGKTGYLSAHRVTGAKCLLEGTAALFFKAAMGEQSCINDGLADIANTFNADGKRVCSDYDSFIRNFEGFLAKEGRAQDAPLLPLLAARGLIHQCMLELTHHCNLKCVHCYIGSRGNDKTPETSVLDNIEVVRAFLRRIGCVNLTVTGGEIGLVPNIFGILKKLSEDFVLTVMTNGIVWTECDYLKFKDIPINTVQVTLFSMNPAVHDSISGVAGSWKKVWSSISAIRRLNIPLRISTPVLKRNAASVPELVKELGKAGLQADIDVKCFPQGHGTDCAASIPMVQELVRLGIAPKLQKSECTAIKHKVRIGPDGGVFPCEYLQDKLGSIFDGSTAAGILGSSPANMLLNAVNNDISSADCDGCAARGKCFNCKAFNHAEHKSYLKPNSYICALNKLQYAPFQPEVIC